ncbi:MAG TPA: ectonucleotide pyrophosphatase/phosphodiesterase [Acidobacteriaceae bacterium]|jgi:predicted AlkP superfamily pyrophosphatase or phosphodiesterase|nr:ectonucleotide pyrophosphatase/phosphodiesterase [Acidobacteriaceae bacterium]
MARPHRSPRSVLLAILLSASAACLAATPLTPPAHAHAPDPLVLISIDGMKPEYVTHAAEHGLKVPELRSFLTAGVYAQGVIGVEPTVTYPSHTTLVTGVWPIQHGVYDNTLFDPSGQHTNEWYVDFKYIKVETLYQAVDQAGYKTAAVGWPVTVGAPIDYNIAEFAQSEQVSGPQVSPYNPPDILTELGPAAAPAGDEDVVKTAQAVAILDKFHPTLLLVHLTDLDEQEHQHGPFSTEADTAIEIIDGQVHQIEQAALAVNPKTRIAVVSDHGFLAVDHRVNLNALFAQNNLIHLGPPAPGKTRPTIESWDAEAWSAGGDDAIMLRQPDDQATLHRVEAVLKTAEGNPEDGIARVLDHQQIVKRGGFPHASFLVDFKDDFDPGKALTGPVVVPATHTGMHGYLASRPAMRSAFMIKGAGIAKDRDLDIIDMRQIAPTLARLLDVHLPDATQPPVLVTP